MALSNISKNELFQLGQYKCQLLTLDVSNTDAVTITNANLKTYQGPEFSFSRVHAIFRMSSANTSVYYTVNSVGRLASVTVTSSAAACVTVWIIGE